MTLERIHLVLEPHLMKAFRETAVKNHRSVSGQLASMVEEEIDRCEAEEAYIQRLADERAIRENDSHLPNP